MFNWIKKLWGMARSLRDGFNLRNSTRLPKNLPKRKIRVFFEF